MLGFLFRVAAGTVKFGVKYIVVPAIVSVAITLAAEALADGIRNHTPETPSGHAQASRRPAPARKPAAARPRKSVPSRT